MYRTANLITASLAALLFVVLAALLGLTMLHTQSTTADDATALSDANRAGFSALLIEDNRLVSTAAQ